MGEQPGRIVQKQALVPLDDHDGVLVVFAAEPQERRVQVEGVAGDHVEEAAVAGTDPLQQAFGGRLFPFTGLEQFHIQRHRQVVPRQMATTPR